MDRRSLLLPVAGVGAAHDLTSANAWTAALVIMAVSEVVVRLVILRVRAHQTIRTASFASSVAA